MIHYVRREYAASTEKYQGALHLCENWDDWYLQSTALAGIGKNLMIQRYFTEAIPWFDRSLALSDAAGAEYSKARLWSELAICHMGLGDSEKALGLLYQAEKVTWDLGAIPAYQICLADIGGILFGRGEFAAALSYYTRALGFARQIKDPVSEAKCNR